MQSHARAPVMPASAPWSHPAGAVADLVGRFGCVGFKIETEGEGAATDDLILLKRTVDAFAPLVLKIGGVNARTDLAMARTMGIRHLVAPMVESAYAVENFRAALDAVFGRTTELEPAINVESIGACRNLDEILPAAVKAGMTQVTIGRSDLSHSMSVGTEDPALWERLETIAVRAKQHGLRVAVGGNITPASARRIALSLPQVDRVETRSVVFGVHACADIGESVAAAIRFEILHLQERRQSVADRADSLTDRIAELRQRAVAAQ